MSRFTSLASDLSGSSKHAIFSGVTEEIDHMQDIFAPEDEEDTKATTNPSPLFFTSARGNTLSAPRLVGRSAMHKRGRETPRVCNKAAEEKYRAGSVMRGNIIQEDDHMQDVFAPGDEDALKSTISLSPPFLTSARGNTLSAARIPLGPAAHKKKREMLKEKLVRKKAAQEASGLSEEEGLDKPTPSLYPLFFTSVRGNALSAARLARGRAMHKKEREMLEEMLADKRASEEKERVGSEEKGLEMQWNGDLEEAKHVKDEKTNGTHATGKASFDFNNLVFRPK